MSVDARAARLKGAQETQPRTTSAFPALAAEAPPTALDTSFSATLRLCGCRKRSLLWQPTGVEISEHYWATAALAGGQTSTHQRRWPPLDVNQPSRSVSLQQAVFGCLLWNPCRELTRIANRGSALLARISSKAKVNAIINNDSAGDENNLIILASPQIYPVAAPNIHMHFTHKQTYMYTLYAHTYTTCRTCICVDGHKVACSS